MCFEFVNMHEHDKNMKKCIVIDIIDWVRSNIPDSTIAEQSRYLIKQIQIWETNVKSSYDPLFVKNTEHVLYHLIVVHWRRDTSYILPLIYLIRCTVK